MLLLSLPAPLSLLLLRLLGPRLLRPLLGFLGAVAVGTLCGDALLHLLPHVGAAPPCPLPQAPPPRPPPRHRTSSVPPQPQPAAAFWWGVWVKATPGEGCCRARGASGACR